MVDPSNPLHPTEKAKGPGTSNFQDPSKHLRTSASEVILPAIPPADPWHFFAPSLLTSTTDQSTIMVSTFQEFPDYPSQLNPPPGLYESLPPSFSTPIPDASTSHNSPAPDTADPWHFFAPSLLTSTTDQPTIMVSTFQEFPDYPSQLSPPPGLYESLPPSFSTFIPDGSTSHNPPAPNTASVSTKGPVYKDTVTTHKNRRASLARRRADAKFTCSFEGCGADFTRKHNLERKFKNTLHCHADRHPLQAI